MKASSFVLGVIAGAHCTFASALIIDFETVPVRAQGPSTFATATAETITVGGVSISGGAVLGLPSFLPASPFGTLPNLYGTADHPSGGAVLTGGSAVIEILISGGATSVEGVLLNGLIAPDSFVVEAFDASNALVDSDQFLDLPSNSGQGNAVFRLAGTGITRVTISPNLGGAVPREWDYFIDTIAIDEPIENSRVPEPGTLALLGIGLAGLAARLSRRR